MTMTTTTDGDVSLVRHSGASDGSHLLRALAVEPRAVIYDLADVVADPATIRSTFDTLEDYLADWPTTPVLVSVGQGASRKALQRHPVRRRVTSWFGTAPAMAAADRLPPVRRTVLYLEPGLKAPRLARDFVRQNALLPPGAALLETAILLVSELVTNSVQHAAGPIMVSVSRSRATDPRPVAVRIGVHDGDNGQPVLSRGSRDLDHGRGLWHVDSLSRSWGTIPLEQGKVVWTVVDGNDRPMTW